MGTVSKCTQTGDYDPNGSHLPNFLDRMKTKCGSLVGEGDKTGNLDCFYEAASKLNYYINRIAVGPDSWAQYGGGVPATIKDANTKAPINVSPQTFDGLFTAVQISSGLAATTPASDPSELKAVSTSLINAGKPIERPTSWSLSNIRGYLPEPEGLAKALGSDLGRATGHADSTKTWTDEAICKAYNGMTTVKVFGAPGFPAGTIQIKNKKTYHGHIAAGQPNTPGGAGVIGYVGKCVVQVNPVPGKIEIEPTSSHAIAQRLPNRDDPKGAMFISKPSGLRPVGGVSKKTGGSTRVPASEEGATIDYTLGTHGSWAEAVSAWTEGHETATVGLSKGALTSGVLTQAPQRDILKVKLKALLGWTDELLGSYSNEIDSDGTDNLKLLKVDINAAIALLASPGLTSCANDANDAIGWIAKQGQTNVGVALNDPLVGNAQTRLDNAQDQRQANQNAGGAFGAATVTVSRDIKYKEQCILLSQISTLAQYRRNLDKVDPKANRRLPYIPGGQYFGGETKETNAPLLVEGESFGFMNKLTQYGGMKQFFDMTNAEIAGLQPLIRLYKVRNANDPSAKTAEQEIAFDSYATKEDVTSIFETKERRGFGVGIKDFKISYEGQDLFAQKKSIKATLKLQANSFSELLKERGTNGQKYRYIDLALKTGTKFIEKRPELDELNFRLKATFGWVPITNTILRKEVVTALKGTFVSVNLTPVTHNFDFDDLGRVTFTIEYFAYIDEFYDKPRMNIFTHAGTYTNVLKRKIAYASATKAAKCDNDEASQREKIAKQKKDEVDKIEKEKISMLNRIFAQLFRDKKIYFLNLSRQQLTEVISLGPYFKFTTGVALTTPDADLSESMQSRLATAWKRKFAAAPGGSDRKTNDALEASLLVGGVDSVQIPFFYVGDLLDLILGSMEEFLNETATGIGNATKYGSGDNAIPFDDEVKAVEMNAITKSIAEFERFRLVLGPLEIIDHMNDSANYQNFGDIPISVKYMSEWLTSKLLKKDQAVYPLTQFLKDLFNDLIKKFLNDDTCYPFSIKQKVRLFQSVVTSFPGAQKPDEITARAKSQTAHRLNIFTVDNKETPFLNISGKSTFDRPNPGDEMNYFIFFGGRTQPMNLMNGKRSEDEDRGIFHYLLGKNRGIVKTIKLNKTNAPGLKEVRFEQEGYDGLKQLREIYDVSIDTYANIRAFPGNYIFVDPKGFDPSLTSYDQDKFDLTDLGVGGYFMIIRSEHEFAPGRANTNLTAVWVASAAGADENRMIEEGVGANNEVKAKCKAKRDKDAHARLATSAVGVDVKAQTYTGNKVEHTPE